MSDHRFALVHEGDVFVFITNNDLKCGYDRPDSFEVYAVFGTVKVEGKPAVEQGWWIFPANVAPQAIVAKVPRRAPLAGYELSRRHRHLARGRRPAYPRTLTAEEYTARAWESKPGYDPVVDAAYVAVWGEPFVEDVVIDGPWVRLDDQPYRPGPGMSYKAELPYELRNLGAYRHLFPGRLSGFPVAAGNWLAKHFADDPDIRVEHYDWRNGSVTITAKAARGGAKLAELDSSRDLKIPAHFDGTSFADARTKWEAELERLAEEVRERAMPCPCCNGSGKWRDTPAAKTAKPKPRPAASDSALDDDIPF